MHPWVAIPRGARGLGQPRWPPSAEPGTASTPGQVRTQEPPGAGCAAGQTETQTRPLLTDLTSRDCPQSQWRQDTSIQHSACDPDGETSARRLCLRLDAAASSPPCGLCVVSPVDGSSRAAVSACSGGCDKVPWTGQLKQGTFILSPAWRLESEIKVWAGWLLPRPLSEACRRPFPPCVLTWSSLRGCLCPDPRFL